MEMSSRFAFMRPERNATRLAIRLLGGETMLSSEFRDYLALCPIRCYYHVMLPISNVPSHVSCR